MRDTNVFLAKNSFEKFQWVSINVNNVTKIVRIRNYIVAIDRLGSNVQMGDSSKHQCTNRWLFEMQITIDLLIKTNN